jgi:23S rRNA 5-hydroxycytidine C2501 synthase
MRELELLAPAKDYECGEAAINAGADAIYIGASKFSARVNAGNNIEEIRKLIDYGHKFRVKIYITINTILYDNELDEVKKLIYDLYEMGADAIIIQDYAMFEMDLPPIPLIASTQMHNDSIDKIKFLEQIGIQRAILARELSLKQIREIKSNTNIELEYFIHGSLCVSYSGQCYFSQSINKRSANRGSCSQPCRMKYDLIDKHGNTLAKDKHLLSLKDLNLSKHLSGLISAGITSFKIEGRLKDKGYVKNITAFYRQKIDEIILKNNNLKRSSLGKSDIPFSPNPYKSFNRGFTSYFIDNRNPEMVSFETEKSMGERIGTVKSVSQKYFTLKEKHDLHNGDGICYFDNGILNGTNINKVEDEKIYPPKITGLKTGTMIYRNFDARFEKILENQKSTRKIFIDIEFGETPGGFYVKCSDEEKIEAAYSLEYEKEIADNEPKSYETIKKQISSLGNTIYEVSTFHIKIARGYFISVKDLNEMRRELIKILDEERIKHYSRKTVVIEQNDYPFPEKVLDYKANIANEKALMFVQRHGAVVKEKAFELLENNKGKELMVTKYCIRYQLGECPKENKKGKTSLSFPWRLKNNQNNFRLEFDCKKCEMSIVLE